MSSAITVQTTSMRKTVRMRHVAPHHHCWNSLFLKFPGAAGPWLPGRCPEWPPLQSSPGAWDRESREAHGNLQDTCPAIPTAHTSTSCQPEVNAKQNKFKLHYKLTFLSSLHQAPMQHNLTWRTWAKLTTTVDWALETSFSNCHGWLGIKNQFPFLYHGHPYSTIMVDWASETSFHAITMVTLI